MTKMIVMGNNCTNRPYPRERNIHSFFEEAAQKHPNRIAVEFGNESVTYRELNDSANMLAAVIQKSNVEVGDVVVVSVERSINMMIAILAVLKSGAAYLPISINIPEERKRYYIETAKAQLILSERDENTLYNIPNVNIQKSPPKEESLQNPRVSSDALAYVIFTSGSTGNPKGVMIKHHSVVNRLLWMKEQYGLCEEDIFLQKTPYSFDVSVWEIFLWFFCGAKLCLLKPGHEGNAETLINTIHSYEVTACHFVPSVMSAFLEFLSHRGGLERISCLKNVFSSGEALKYDLIIKFNNMLTKENETKLHNLYGPTEATVDVTFFDCTGYHSEDRIVPIGKPIWNTKIYVLDENGEECIDGEKGELYISGDNVAMGYINNSELTEKSFVPDPFCVGTMMYKTGDLGRWNNGNIEFFGRTDNQVKIHGIRIELEEIENHIVSYEPVTQAIVVAIGNDEKSLIAYYSGKSAVNTALLIDYLSEKLPAPMIPVEFVFIENFPLNQNGKVDRKKVELLYREKSNVDYDCNEVMRIIKKVVDREINENDSLSQSDMDSITFIRIVVALESEFDFEFDDEMLLIKKFPTIKSMIEYVESKVN